MGNKETQCVSSRPSVRRYSQQTQQLEQRHQQQTQHVEQRQAQQQQRRQVHQQQTSTNRGLVVVAIKTLS